MRKPTKYLRVAVVVCGALAALVVIKHGLRNHTPSGLSQVALVRNPGPFARQTWEAVVEQVRAAGLQPGETREYVVDSLSAPKQLLPVPPGRVLARGSGAGQVWAEVSTDGKLKVVIATRDLGHAGVYGFAYSDVPLSPKPFGSDGTWFTLAVPSPLKLVRPEMRIDDHWWAVEYNLD